MSRSGYAYLLAILCIASWSLIPVVSKMVTQDVSPFQFLLLSNVLSAIMALALAISRKSGWHIVRRDARRNIWRTLIPGFLGCYFYYLCLYYGFQNAEAISVLVVQYLWPVIVVLLAPLFFSRSISVRSLVAVAIGFIGAGIVATRGDLSAVSKIDFATIGIVFIGSCSFALFTLTSPRVSGDPATTVFMFFSWATLYSLITVLAGEGVAMPKSWQSWLGLLVNGSIINGVSYFWWLRASQLLNPARLAPLVFIAPVLAALWLMIFFRAPFYPVYALGFGLCLAGGYMATRSTPT